MNFPVGWRYIEEVASLPGTGHVGNTGTHNHTSSDLRGLKGDHMPVMYVCNQCGKQGKLNADGVCESCAGLSKWIWGKNAVGTREETPEEKAAREKKLADLVAQKRCTRCKKRLSWLRHMYLTRWCKVRAYSYRCKKCG